MNPVVNSSINPDEWEIVRLLNRYTDAVNQRDWETYRACWVEGGVWELHDPINGHYAGIEAIMTEVRRAVESQQLFVQMNHAITVLSIEGETARARVTLNEIGKADPKGAGALPGVGGMTLLAYYTDDLIKQDGAWKFSKRTYDVVYADFTTPPGKTFPLRPAK